TSINENYVDGKVDNGFLDCPTTARNKMRPDAVTEKPEPVNNSLTATVYPNPSRGQLNVNLAKIPAGSEVQIINSRGAVVARRAAGGAQSLSFDVSKYGAGIFLVKVISGSNVQTIKAIVQQ
ncbi:MAG: T9SS type A sorting domain-containing protein, partial [Bacteroidota bacterium]